MVVRPVVVSLRSLGLDVARILARAQLSEELLRHKSQRIPVEQELALWREADAVSGDPTLGLRIAKHFEPGVLGSLGYLLRNSEHLLALAERAQRFCRLMDDLAHVEVRAEGDEARLTFARRGHYPVPESGVECLFAVAFITGHAMWPTARARRVTFTHKQRGELAPYESRFGCRVVFGAEENAIVFDEPWLRAPAENADPKLARVLEAHTEHLLAQLPVPHSFVELAREELRKALGAGEARPEALARALRVSERTLRRRLQQEGVSYQALLDDVRHGLARALVLRPDLSIAQVAEQLGFSEVSTFYRAFKRWTGLTPAQFQKRGR
jgi:AraC-like DNA-binding protein